MSVAFDNIKAAEEDKNDYDEQRRRSSTNIVKDRSKGAVIANNLATPDGGFDLNDEDTYGTVE